jgi:hypothetical protein
MRVVPVTPFYLLTSYLLKALAVPQSSLILELPMKICQKT